jgi:hypothetical protein
MKNLLLLSLLAVATVEASAQTTPTSAEATTTSATTTRKTAKERRADRKSKSPEVYKGSVAEQHRLLTDADGADKDPDAADDTKPSKKAKHKKKNKEKE